MKAGDISCHSLAALPMQVFLFSEYSLKEAKISSFFAHYSLACRLFYKFLQSYLQLLSPA